MNFQHLIQSSRKQIYDWFIQSEILKIEMLKSKLLYFDSQIVSKFLSLELIKDEGKINQMKLINKEEFVAEGEDKQIIIWNPEEINIKNYDTMSRNIECTQIQIYKNDMS
ncbi:unnamed protein product [Paramecium sonneborni]|uniref:Uncharacterized protein n=1 Tax=Paramecium sonneborni TaxID=65129 RepID=A0A8S1PFS7_9CILI|nr:unnamed protein product [Paramecium sonneborni]